MPWLSGKKTLHKPSISYREDHMRHRQEGKRCRSQLNLQTAASRYICFFNYNSDHDLSYKDTNKPLTQSNINERTPGNSMTIQLYGYLLSVNGNFNLHLHLRIAKNLKMNTECQNKWKRKEEMILLSTEVI